MTKRETIAEKFPELLFADGFDDAIIGVVEQFNKTFVVYDYEAVIKTLMKDMSREEAEEFYGFNIVGAYVGDHTPAFIRFYS
jgi:hypothetical protein